MKSNAELMQPDLIVIANAVQARLYERPSATEPQLVLRETLQSPSGRQRPHELGDAPLGHAASDRRVAGVAFEPRINPQRKRHVAFARQLAQRLDADLARGGYGRVALFAGCPFLGELKAQLSPAAKKALCAAVAVDLTHFGASELQRRVDEELRAEAAAQPSAG